MWTKKNRDVDGSFQDDKALVLFKELCNLKLSETHVKLKTKKRLQVQNVPTALLKPTKVLIFND
jgi:hypothetical protein